MPLTSEEVSFMIKRNDSMKQTKALYEPLLREITEFIFTRRAGIGYQPTPGQKLTTKQYDSTAEFANMLLAASMHGTLTPSSSVWHAFKLRDDRLNRIKEVMDWTETCVRMMTSASRQSKFNSEVHEVYLDLGALATGCLFVDEKPITRLGFNGFRFKAHFISEYCIEQNANQEVDTLFREFELSARVAIEEFGYDKVGEKIRDKVSKAPDDKFKFLKCTMPNSIRRGLPFVSYYISLEDKKWLRDGFYHEFPYMVPRWSLLSNEIYGRGLGHAALPDVRTLNKAKELGLKAWAKDLDPATFEKDGGVIGDLDLRPAGRNVVKDKDSVWTFDNKSRYDISQIKEEELRKSIRQIFFSDQLKLQEGPEMTAMEVQVRFELMQRLLGPTMGRFESEFLNPLLEREFGILMRARVLPEPPAILRRMGIAELDIEYEGPLARSQRMSEMAAMQRLYTFAGTLAQARPDPVRSPMDNLDDDVAVRHAAELLGTPSKVLRSEEDVEDTREEKRQALENERMKADAERAATGLGRAAPALKILSEMGGGIAGEAEGAA